MQVASIQIIDDLAFDQLEGGAGSAALRMQTQSYGLLLKADARRVGMLQRAFRASQAALPLSVLLALQRRACLYM